MEQTTLVLGSQGQLGTEIVTALMLKENQRILCADLREKVEQGHEFFEVDVLNKGTLRRIFESEKIDRIYHLAAVLSAKGEENPEMAWRVNMDGLLNVLELAREFEVSRIFWPSSIAIFGPGTERQSTPQHDYFDPTSVYGISKLAGELWCKYYHEKFGLDIRSLRYPGVISYKTRPGGGTTDYAVDIFFKAVEENRYECFLSRDMSLPMIYVDDAVRATLELMDADRKDINERTSYNLAAISFTPEILAEAIKSKMPDFKISYQPDFRNEIAASWPDSIDDSRARSDWQWDHEYDLERLVSTMIAGVRSVI